MAALDISERAPLLVHDHLGEPVAIPNGSITGENTAGVISLSPLNAGAIDVIAEGVGTCTLTVTIGAASGSLEITVTEADPGVLVVTLGTPVPK